MRQKLQNFDKDDEYFGSIFKELNCEADEIRNKSFEGCSFKSCNFNGASLLGCKFIDCEFDNCNLNNAVITNSVFLSVVFNSSTLIGIDWTKAKWPHIKLSSSMSFYECNISYSIFFGLICSEINILQCKAHNVILGKQICRIAT